MRSRSSLAVIVITGIVGALGCGTLSIPQVAVEGTTVLIPVPGNFEAGFGRVLSDAADAQLPALTAGVSALPGVPSYSPTSALEDELRGELVFQLRSSSNAAIAILPVLALTRVAMDETSVIGDAGDTSDHWPGQILALVNIPLGVVTANNGSHSFTIYVRRYIRDVAYPYAFQLVSPPLVGGTPWRGWGGTVNPPAAIPIKIYPSQEGNTPLFNPLVGADAVGGTYYDEDIADNLQDLVSKPAVTLFVLEENLGAWEVELEYPRSKVKILGVEAVIGQKSAKTAIFTPDPVPYTNDLVGCDSDSGTGRVKVGAVDPGAVTIGDIRVVVEPRPLWCSGGAGRFDGGDLQPDPATFRAYDVDGNDLSGQASLTVAEKVL